MAPSVVDTHGSSFSDGNPCSSPLTEFDPLEALLGDAVVETLPMCEDDRVLSSVLETGTLLSKAEVEVFDLTVVVRPPTELPKEVENLVCDAVTTTVFRTVPLVNIVEPELLKICERISSDVVKAGGPVPDSCVADRVSLVSPESEVCDLWPGVTSGTLLVATGLVDGVST